MTDPQPDPNAAVKAVLSEHLTANAEWKAYLARVTRILLKRQEGKPLGKEENAILADYREASKLDTPPLDKHGQPAPPIFYSYSECADLLPWDRRTLMNARASKCPAFTGNMIFTASLVRWFTDNPNGPTAKHRHTGREPKLTPKLKAIVIDSLRKCPVLEIAAGAAGISRGTLFDWRRKGKEGLSPYAEFLHETEVAMDEVKLNLVQDIATDPAWQAKLAVLERIEKLFHRPALTAKAEATGGDGKAVTLMINLSGVDSNPYADNEPET